MSERTPGGGAGRPTGLLHRAARLFRSRHPIRLHPHPGPASQADVALAIGGKSGALRAAIFGINDGLLSNLSLIMGVTGGAASNRIILLAGVAGLLAGAFSMGTGEYVSMRFQRELFERLLHLEAHEIANDPQEEHAELRRIYEDRGYPPELAERVTGVVMSDPATALDTHAREELGLDPEELGSPWGAAASSFTMFALGALVPLLPFIVGSGTAAVLSAIAASGVALVVVGALMTRFTGRRVWMSSLRMLLVGAVAASVTFGVGLLLHVSAA